MKSGDFVAGMVVGGIIMAIFMHLMSVPYLPARNRAIEIGKAQYNPKTGEVEWNDPAVRYVLKGGQRPEFNSNTSVNY